MGHTEQLLTLGRFVLLGFLALSLGCAVAADRYPDRPVTLVIPYGADSDTHYFGQVLAKHVAKYMDNASIVLENRAGASGTLGANSVRSAPPDGYTLMIGRVGTQTIAPAMDPSLSYRWYNFSFLGLLEVDPLVCAVRSDSLHKTARELLADMRKSPGTKKFGTTGSGSIQNLSAQYLLKLAGLKNGAAIPVAYTGGQGAADGLIGGQIDFLCSNARSLIEPIKNGRVRGLLTTAPGRLTELPDLPNAREAGMRDMANLLGWSALVAPRGLPEHVTTRWREALQKLSRDPAWLADISKGGGIAVLGTAKDREKFIKEQAELFESLIPELGLRQ